MAGGGRPWSALPTQPIPPGFRLDCTACPGHRASNGCAVQAGVQQGTWCVPSCFLYLGSIPTRQTCIALKFKTNNVRSDKY